MFAVRSAAVLMLLAAIAGRAEPDEPTPETTDLRTVGFPAGEADSGADGRFFRVTTTVDRTAVEVEEPFTLTVRITTPEIPVRSPRRIDLTTVPAFADRFYILDEDDTPEEVPAAVALAGLSGSMFGAPFLTAALLAPQTEWVFVYRLKPRAPDVAEVPVFTFAYYDPVSQVETPEKRWHVPYADQILLSVRPREGAVVPLRAPEWAFRLAAGDLAERREPWSPPGLALLTVLLVAPPLLAWCWYLAWRRLHPDAARRALQRRSRSARRALELLVRARRLPIPRRADAVARVVAAYLRERFDFPAAEPTPAEVRSHLAAMSCSPAVAAEADRFFGASDAARFQPGAANAASLCDSAERLIVALEAETWTAPRGNAGRILSVLGAFLCGVLTASGADPALPGDLSTSAIAEQGRASFAEGVRLREAADRARPHFYAAARCFEELRRRGARNPALYRNLGNAHLLADELGPAVFAYRAGLTRWPEDRDLRAGLTEARKRVVYGAGTFGHPPAERLPFWLPPFRPAWLFAGTVACYALACSCLARWLMVRTRRPWVFGLVSLGMAAVLAAGFVVSLHTEREELDHPLVVVIDDGVLLLKGDGNNYPPRYDTPVNQGVEARLLFQRDGWLQIELSGGEVGWVSEKYALVERP